MPRRRPAPLVLAAVLVALAGAASAQPAGRWSDVFAYPGARLTETGYYSNYSAPPATVWAVEPDGRGGYYVGGQFDTIDGVALSGVAHWDGRAWAPLGDGLRLSTPYPAPPTVYDLMVASDGTLYATGTFDAAVQANGRAVRAAGVARWTGSAWEALGGGLAYNYASDVASGRSLAEGPDGSVYVAGPFNAVVSPLGVSAAAHSVARWRGGQWEAVPGIAENSFVTAVAVRADGVVALGGSSSAWATAGAYGANVALSRADGTWEPLFDTGQTGLRSVFALEWDGDALWAGGDLYAVVPPPTGAGDATVIHHVGRWAGGTWSGVGGGTDDAVYDLAPDGSGGVYVAGPFRSVARTDDAFSSQGGAVPASGIARWTGTRWAEVGDVSPPAYFASAPPFAATVAVSGGDVVVGGAFDGVRASDGSVQAAAGVAVRRGGVWRPMSALSGGAAVGLRRSGTFATAVLASAPNPCGRGVLVAGQFETVGAQAAPGVALWDGRAWQGVPGSLRRYGSPGVVRAVAPAGCEGGRARFFVAGDFDTAVQEGGAEVAAPGLAFWDGTRWTALDGTPPAGGVSALVYDGETLVAAGTLRQGAGNGVFGWRAGRGWAPVGSGIDDGNFGAAVNALAVGPDGKLYVGGLFPSVRQPNGLSVNVGGLARWSGTEWEWIGNPTDGAIYALRFGADGALYAGGTFTAFAQPSRPDTPARSVAVWDGAAWSDLGAPGVPVTTLAVADDGRVYVGFDPMLPGVYGDGDRLRASGPGGWQALGIAEGNVATLTLDGSDLYVGGSFVEAGPTASAHLALYTGAGATSAGAAPPAAALLVSVAPNPTRGEARLSVSVPEAGRVRVAVCDALGREVAVLVDGPRPAGPLALALDGARLPAGVYVVRATAGGAVATRTLTVVR